MFGRRVLPRPEEEFVLLKDVCANRWVLARFRRRGPHGNEWVDPRRGYVLYTPASPSRTDVVIGNKRYSVIEAIGCAPIFSAEDASRFLQNLGVASVAIGDREIDVADPHAAEQLYEFLAQAYEERSQRGGRVWTAYRGGVRLAIALPNYDKIAQIIGTVLYSLSKATAVAARTVDAIAETQRLARRGPSPAPGWLWPLVAFGIVAMALLFVFHR